MSLRSEELFVDRLLVVAENHVTEEWQLVAAGAALIRRSFFRYILQHRFDTLSRETKPYTYTPHVSGQFKNAIEYRQLYQFAIRKPDFSKEDLLLFHGAL